MLTEARPSYGDVLRDRAFQALTLANFVSLTGDQIARVALSVLVYNRTSSSALTGLTYALSYLPTVLGGPLLAGLADRRPRRGLMVACDLIRVVLVAAMALPGMPLAVLWGLLAAVTLCEGPFDAARGAMMPDVLAGERYAIGGAISQVVLQAAMVTGFAAGGALLLVATPRQLLALDAGTFLLSAALVRRVPHGRERVSAELEGRARPLADVRLAVRLILGHAQLRPLVLVAWCLSAAAVAPEALAVPYVRQTAAGYGGVGLLLAIGPIGNVLAGLTLARLPEDRRLPLLWPLALLATAPLTLCLLRPPFLVTVALVALSGMGTAYHLVAMVRFVTLVAPEVRGRALGIAGTGLAVGQGLATAVAGILGDLLGPASAIGVAGVAGVVAVALCGRGLQVRAEG